MKDKILAKGSTINLFIGIIGFTFFLILFVLLINSLIKNGSELWFFELMILLGFGLACKLFLFRRLTFITENAIRITYWITNKEQYYLPFDKLKSIELRSLSRATTLILQTKNDNKIKIVVNREIKMILL